MTAAVAPPIGFPLSGSKGWVVLVQRVQIIVDRVQTVCNYGVSISC